VQFFRRSQSPSAKAVVRFKALRPGAEYVLENFDTKTQVKVGEAELSKGYELELLEPRSSGIIRYRTAEAEGEADIIRTVHAASNEITVGPVRPDSV